jgi:PAS domain S-box-containing protein
MADVSAMERLARRLTFVGGALLVAAAIAFVWAVAFTSGVEGLLEGLVVSGIGLFLPGAAILWVAWIIGNAVGDEHPLEITMSEPRPAWLLVVRDYALAAAAVAVATGLRLWLWPYVGPHASFGVFYLAVAVSAWVGGIGPSTLATIACVPIIVMMFFGDPASGVGATGDLVNLGMFVTVGLAIGGITSALRHARVRTAALRANVISHTAALEESENRFREMADDAPALIRLFDANGQCTFFNKSWLEFTGRTMEQERGEGWTRGIHPDDVGRCLTTYRRALDRRQRFDIEYRLRRHDDVYRVVVDQGSPRFRGNGEFAGFIAACMDISDASRALAETPRIPAPLRSPTDPAAPVG